MTTSQVAAAVRGLTQRWLAALAPERDTVVSGAGLWPLLALVCGAADGQARQELAAAVGMPADAAAEAASEALAVLDASPDIAAASGTWVREGIELHPWWRAHVPPASTGELPGRRVLDAQAALDAWARERTDGLIEQMPVQLTDDIVLVLATALVVRTRWVEPFTEQERGGRTWLQRTVSGVGDVHTVTGQNGPVTIATIRGKQDVDVLLGLGVEDARSSDTLRALLTGERAAEGAQLLDGPGSAPGVRVCEIRGQAPRTALTVPAFEVRNTHDLLREAEVLGLRAAHEHGGFPRLSDTPTRVEQGAHEVMARLFATGFEAAAVTGFGMRPVAFVLEPATRELQVSFDRPFGFAAVHRPTGMPIVAGWLADMWSAVGS